MKDKSTSSVVKCMKMNSKELVSQNNDCIALGLNLYKATKLSNKDLKKIIKIINNKYPDQVKLLQVISNRKPFAALLKSDKKIFLKVFNNCGSVYRKKYFNSLIPKSVLDSLKTKKEFGQMIKLIVTNHNLDRLQVSLFGLNPTNLDHKSTFFLAINAIKHRRIRMASRLLKLSFDNAYYKMDKDKVLFWQYRLSKKSNYLLELSKSWDLNIYSLYAYEKLSKEPKNIVYNIYNNTKTNFDTKNPFNWFYVLQDIKKLDQNKLNRYKQILSDSSTIGHMSFIYEKFYRYKITYLITPYNKILKNMTTERKTLIYSIARQESRFIPASISSSYAMGLMQVMPFLSKHIAKQLKDKYNIYKQLEPRTNLRYANYHLNYLKKHLHHPLFIAYAYNGGIGFMKRTFKDKLFKKGRFEPYLSMELVKYDETKRYGKKVLANYILYYNYLNKKHKIKISQLLSKAISPL